MTAVLLTFCEALADLPPLAVAPIMKEATDAPQESADAP